MSRWSKITLGLVTVLGLAACVFLGVFFAGQGLVRAALWATVVGALAGVLAAVAGVVAAAGAIWPLVRSPRPAVPPGLALPDWVVSRPAEVKQVANALLRSRSQAAGITTALHGAGGFGKTTVALMVCADRRVRRWFRGGVYWVTIGRDATGRAALAGKVNDLIKLVAGQEATFTDPEVAGLRLGALLNTGPRRLLVIDDVWAAEQLAPFAAGGKRCVRLVTTRISGLLVGREVAVRVDQMSTSQAEQLLSTGLPPLDPAVSKGFLTETGRWPLLLRLVNKVPSKTRSTRMHGLIQEN